MSEPTESETDRPSFRVNNRTYISAGALPYTVSKDGTIYFLIQKVKGRSWHYEDFGGKSQLGDQSIKDVAFRECTEELNNLLTEEFLLSLPCIEHLIACNKYVLYLVELDSSFMDKDLSMFGDHEVLWNVERTVVWLSYADLWNMHPTLLHPRLQPDFKHWLALLLTEADTF
jgi:hypothetical protein